MPASPAFNSLLDDYLTKRNRLAEVQAARQGGINAHITAAFSPVDGNSQVDSRLAQIASDNVEEFYADLGALVESHVRSQVERAKKLLDRQYEIEVS